MQNPIPASTVLKLCFKCDTIKPLSEFYKHSEMGDGHLGKCKECTKADVKRDYRENRDAHVAYEKKRWLTIKKARERLRKSSPEYRAYKAAWYAKNAAKVKAHSLVKKLVAKGVLVKTPCTVCGAGKSEGHHTDYSKPADVIWLCVDCHRLEHARLRGVI